jgi:DNA helicase II / ATP-dependent DNA helicase PcrA
MFDPHANEPAYLRGLNGPQQQAVTNIDGPVLLLAGAGTGKTRALTARLAHILASRKAWPSEILAVTFTNRAAREMQQRVGSLIGEAVEGMPWLGTFHAVAARMLRRHAELVGLKSNYTILDTDDQLRLVKQVLQLAEVDEKRWPAKQLAHHIDAWKNKALTPEQLPASEAQIFADGKAIALYAAYQARLRTLNACDFGDLLLHMISIWQKHHDVLAQWQQRFKYVLVDEYQDTNVAQYLWLRLIAQARKNICCVGDEDQSIYGWRGAEIANILKFEQDYPGAKIIRLEQNYRSGEHILAAASYLIASNTERLGKTLWTEQAGGEKVRVVSVWDGAEEARHVGQEIEQRLGRGERLSEVAVLVRASHQTRAFEDRFITLGLPYRIVGGFRFYERQEIRDAIAYLRVISQPEDDLAFERIVNTPKRGLGDKSLQKVYAFARARSMPMLRAASQLVETDELPSAARRSLGNLVKDIARWRDALPALPHTEVARTMLEESGYVAMWQADRSPEAAGRLENLNELLRAMDEFENLGGFLEHVSLVMENESNVSDDKITVMTLHAAKGLEFDAVYLAGWEEGIFPNQRSLDENGNAALEEERRLAYVGITRARKRCTISHAANRLIYGQWQSAIPSRFIDELPRDHIEIESTLSGSDRGLWQSGIGSNDPFAHLARSGGRGPGWARAQTHYRGSDRMIEAAATVLKKSASSFRAGDRVFHDKFGYGRVDGVDGNKLEIEFDTAGRKHVVDSFVQSA